MRFTPEQAMSHLTGNQERCPACDGESLYFGSLEYEGTQVSEHISCHDCEASWYACYALSHCVDAESGDLVAELLPRVLITVKGGVADWVADPAVDVAVLDWDNHQAGDPADVSESHLQLLAQSDPEAAAILQTERSCP